MAKLEKGQPGYIKARKTKYLIGSIAEFAIVIALLIIGYTQTGTRLNWLTLFAILGCLPASKMLVEFITMAPHKGVDISICEELNEKAPLLVKTYDMIITSKEKIMPVDVVVIYGNTVCGYTSSPKIDEAKCSRYLKEMLTANHYDKMTVKVFRDYKAFLSRAEGMNNMAAVEKNESKRREKEIKRLILTVSM